MTRRGRRLDESRAYLRAAQTAQPLGSVSRVRIVGEGQMSGKKAPEDGVYTLANARFRIRKGAILPDSAKFEAQALPGRVRVRAVERSRAEAEALSQEIENERAGGYENQKVTAESLVNEAQDAATKLLEDARKEAEAILAAARDSVAAAAPAEEPPAKPADEEPPAKPADDPKTKKN